MHALGYQGQGVHTVVVDGGFSNAYRTRVFDSLYLEGRVLEERDFVDGDDWIYEHSTHGTNMLSTMAANIKGFMVGTAPKASYYLFKTEDTRNEYIAEEWFWIAAIEYADSLGVDVVNSSLGYSVFAEKFMSHRYEDLDGQTTMISRAAEIATNKGLLIVNAAGNDGNRKWKYLFAPADVTNVLAVAAVTDSNTRASFSSWGPTPDGRIKPDVSAIGEEAVIISIVDYSTGFTSGTSYSSPILCGLVIDLRQAFPFASNEAIRSAVKQSGHLADKPNEVLGYGAPDFLKAYWLLSPASIWLSKDRMAISNKKLIHNQLKILLQDPTKSTLNITIQSSVGQVLIHKTIALKNGLVKEIVLDDFATLPQGAYQVLLQIGKQKQCIAVFK